MLERNPPRAAAGQHHVEQGWVGRVARAGAGEGQQPVVGTQLAALLCRCVVTWPAPPHSPRRTGPRRAATHAGHYAAAAVWVTASCWAETSRYLPIPPVSIYCQPASPRADITRNIKFVRMWDLLLVPIRGSTVTTKCASDLLEWLWGQETLQQWQCDQCAQCCDLGLHLQWPPSPCGPASASCCWPGSASPPAAGASLEPDSPGTISSTQVLCQ